MQRSSKKDKPLIQDQDLQKDKVQSLGRYWRSGILPLWKIRFHYFQAKVFEECYFKRARQGRVFRFIIQIIFEGNQRWDIFIKNR